MTNYVLTINSDKENYSKITDALQVIPSNVKSFWEFSIDEENKLYTTAIAYFMDLIESNMKKLNDLGIKKEHISVWFYKPYKEQCNMEFSPQEMKRLADNGIVLCISCWEV